MQENLLDVWVVSPDFTDKKTTKRSDYSDFLLLEIAKKVYHLKDARVCREHHRGIPRIFSQKREIFASVSHSGRWTFLAFSDRRVGVDGECVCLGQKQKILQKINPIAQKYFGPQEWEILQQQEDEKKIRTFFQWWTAKEAFVKSSEIYLLAGIRQELQDIASQWSWQYFCLEPKKIETFFDAKSPTDKKKSDETFIALTLMWQRHTIAKNSPENPEKNTHNHPQLRFYW